MTLCDVSLAIYERAYGVRVRSVGTMRRIIHQILYDMVLWKFEQSDERTISEFLKMEFDWDNTC